MWYNYSTAHEEHIVGLSEEVTAAGLSLCIDNAHVNLFQCGSGHIQAIHLHSVHNNSLLNYLYVINCAGCTQ